jgi:hypothetical protein
VSLDKKFKKLSKLIAKSLRQKRYNNFLLAGILFSWLAIGASTITYVAAKDPSKDVL